MIKIFSQEQILDFLYEGNSMPNKHKLEYLKNIRYFSINDILHPVSYVSETYICYFTNNNIVAILLYCELLNCNTTIEGYKHYLSYVSVNPVYQKQGIAKKLLYYWVDLCIPIGDSEKGTCKISGFTKKGFDYLRPILQKIQKTKDIIFDDDISF